MTFPGSCQELSPYTQSVELKLAKTCRVIHFYHKPLDQVIGRVWGGEKALRYSHVDFFVMTLLKGCLGQGPEGNVSLFQRSSLSLGVGSQGAGKEIVGFCHCTHPMQDNGEKMCISKALRNFNCS